jgi:hypothetical protein
VYKYCCFFILDFTTTVTVYFRLSFGLILSLALHQSTELTVFTSVAEPPHFYAAPAPDEIFDAAPVVPAPAPAPTLLNSNAKIFKTN